MAHASESQHWYTPEGEPAYELKGANGNMRPPTLRDARKLRLYPGVSSILAVAAKPGLERWKVRQAVLSALTHPGLKGTDEDIDLILTDAAEQGKKAAEKGTAIHAAIENYFLAAPDEEFAGMEKFIEAAKSCLPSYQWMPEKTFTCHFGFGGKLDLFADDEDAWVIDFKSKEFGPEAKAKDLAYDEMLYQLAAYRMGVSRPKARCANVFVSVTHPGLALIHEWTAEELEKGWTCFKALLDFWQASKGYKP